MKRGTLLFLTVALAAWGQQYAYLTGTSGLSLGPGDGSPAWGNRQAPWGAKITVLGENASHYQAQSMDGSTRGWVAKSYVSRSDPKSYFRLTLGNKTFNAVAVPRCGSWQDLGRIYKFETDDGTRAFPLTDIKTITAVGTTRGEYNSLAFKAKAVLKSGEELTGSLCGFTFRTGDLQILETGGGLELDPQTRLWTLESISSPSAAAK